MFLVLRHEFQCLIINVCRVYTTLKFLFFVKFGHGGTLSEQYKIFSLSDMSKFIIYFILLISIFF